MRIGIFTQPLRYNYGGLLQAWALQTVLRRMGHQVVTFDPYPYKKLPLKRMPFSYTKRILNRLRGVNVPIRYEQKFNRDHDIIIQELKPFIDANIQRREFRRVQELLPSDYDAIIAGSDQVWRPKYNNNFYGTTLTNSFFDFAEKWSVKRIAYAASFGTDEWEFTKQQTTRCAHLAQLFDAVSVREESGIALCREHLGVDATHVLDPTLLLSKEDYEALIQHGAKTHAPSGNMLCYVLDESPENVALIQKIADEKHLLPFRSNFIKEGASAEEQVQPPVEQWLRNFRDAEFVVTDSFHACVFSIIFGKPFIVIANKSRGISRYESLLTTFHLTDHLLRSTSEYSSSNNYSLPASITYLLATLRQESLSFIEQALGQE